MCATQSGQRCRHVADPLEQNIAVVDGSHVVFWSDENQAGLESRCIILDLLKSEGVRPLVVFDANIGFKTFGKNVSSDQIADVLGKDITIEIVSSGTAADRRIIELAASEWAIIVSKDTFRDSVLPRPNPKRLGFALPEYNYAAL